MIERRLRMSRIAPPDATVYWLSRRTRNDVFLLYGFSDRGVPTSELRKSVVERSARIPDLSVRLRPTPGDLDYPRWIPCEFQAEQFLEHPATRWSEVLDTLAELLDTGVEATVRPWRIHVFRGITEAPRRTDPDEPTTVVALQISHALVDGKRSSAIARTLFAPGDGDRSDGQHETDAWSRWYSVTDATVGLLRYPFRVAQTVVRGVGAFRAQRALAKATAAGSVPEPGPGFPPTILNRAETPEVSGHLIRTIVLDTQALRVEGRTITVLVLTAVSMALAEYLDSRGESVDRLGAQVPVAVPLTSARNGYRSTGVDLHIDEPDLSRRADRIAADLTARRTRAAHPLLGAQDRVTAVTPARTLRNDIDRHILDTPDSITGHTVVSSVDRGPADLEFGGPVLFTGGFPAIGSVMRLTHGVYGLGDTVTVCVHADPGVLPDLDGYVDMLRAALERVRGIAPGGVG
ncbi:condensation/DUF1298 domains-containing protein [Nocardia bovistercoris]|uniref:DUF1298 domain-containing protein n=1 Tax=Nocardia bovistercoris TaxID=2785916 RepID=A0A931IEI6_9NOCA|nr:DUF1298 domain-containing protein [Nocardia bovistercoris]MBH0779083.1 DUF1298 domain-containing protein [Nocardia bovistercoris]